MEEILEAIRGHAAEAADALVAVQLGSDIDPPLTADSIGAAAAILGRDRAELWLEQLQGHGLVTAFTGALRARGVAVGDDALADPDGAIDIDRLTAFLPRAKAFRCRILKNGAVAGSGVLVGPSLVLTSWHVIAVRPPGQPQEPAPTLSVLLSDDTKQPARVPAKFQSECGDAEFAHAGRVRDAEVVDRNDVALLAMDRPAAIHLGFVPLAAQAPTPHSKSRVVLVHFPDGQDVGIDFGLTHKIRNVSARWRHDVPTMGGSSGGACFNKDLQLLGVHQGEFDNTARFVPLERFLDGVFGLVQTDTAPIALWSLDGSVEGSLVVGRSLYFEAIAKAGEPGTRVRGVRIKRRVVDAGSVGLGYSYDVLDQLLIRRGSSHRLVRISQDEMVPDLVAEIRRRIARNGIELPDPATEPGVAPGQAPPETTAKDRAAVLADAVEAVAADQALTVWFFFDNPTVALSQDARMGLEGFIAAALTKPHLRLVIAGFETVPLPGLEFAGASPPEGEQAPGLVVEFIGGFRRADVVDLLSLASQDLTGQIDVATIEHATDRALLGLDDFNGLYADKDLRTVCDRLRPDLELLHRAGGG